MHDKDFAACVSETIMDSSCNHRWVKKALNLSRESFRGEAGESIHIREK
jgi:hypothetical protein